MSASVSKPVFFRFWKNFARNNGQRNFAARFHRVEFCAGAPGGTRTPNPLIRSQMLYPIELPVRRTAKQFFGEGEGFVKSCRRFGANDDGL